MRLSPNRSPTKADACMIFHATTLHSRLAKYHYSYIRAPHYTYLTYHFEVSKSLWTDRV